MLRKHILTDGGQVLLIEDVTAEETRRAARHFFDSIGGADFFHRLASAFYRLVAADPLIGPMFPGPPEQQARRLARHYIRMYGTPDLSEGWDERFLRAHLGSVIGTQHREKWLELMRRAGDEIGAPEPWFSDFISTMINASGAISAASRGAALARGLHLSRDGDVIGGP
jgi:truncated hemoglobin YjbI